MGQHPSSTSLSGEIIRGEAAKFPHMDPVRAPSRRTGVSSAATGRFSQSQEKGDAGNMMG